MAEIAPNLSYHYWKLTVLGEGVEDADAVPLVLVRGSEFTPDKEITNEDDEGHTGTATTKMATYRASATSSPSFTDKTRYNEGWEDMWYLLLGSADANGNIRKTTKADGVYEYTFAVNPADPQDPAFAMLYNGFAKSPDGDAFRYENCLLNEFEVSGSNEEAPTYTSTFAANFPKFNQPNVTRVLPENNVFTRFIDNAVSGMMKYLCFYYQIYCSRY